MKKLRILLSAVSQKLVLPPEQQKLIAKIKFPCC